MLIKKAGFLKSIKYMRDYPCEGYPEFAVAGRSNAGKSSLINYLTGNSKLAYVSKQPGKTRLINFFTINDNLFLVDLPGYGYAKVSKREQETWDAMMAGYFEAAKNLCLLIILMDIRHDPQPADMRMVEFAQQYQIPFIVALTKADKIAKSKRGNAASHLKKLLPQLENTSVVVVSSKEKFGKEAMLACMEAYLP